MMHTLQPDCVCISAAGSAGDSPSREGHGDSEAETVPLKQRLALYQAAATKEERSPSVVFTSMNMHTYPQTRMSICWGTHSYQITCSDGKIGTDFLLLV